MSLLIIVGLIAWWLIVVCAVALCVNAARGDGRTEVDAGTMPVLGSGRFRTVA